MTPLHERYALRSHLDRVFADAAEEVFRAARIEDNTPLREAAARLPDDHPALVWLEHVATLGLAYRDAIAERENWPSEEEDKKAFTRKALESMRHAGTA
jgi:hypothetical protein